MVSTHSSCQSIIMPQANVFGDVTVNIDGGVALLLVYVVVALGAVARKLLKRLKKRLE